MVGDRGLRQLDGVGGELVNYSAKLVSERAGFLCGGTDANIPRGRTERASRRKCHLKDGVYIELRVCPIIDNSPVAPIGGMLVRPRALGEHLQLG